MRLWLKRNSDVNLREQLSTQIILGILCSELAPGERLPSTRELAQRHGIHPNTASAAYKELEDQGWLEVRHGSGVYARATQPSTPLTPEIAVDQLIANLVARARKLGADDQLVRARMERWLELAPPARWLLIEPDAALCEIVLTELATALELPMTGCTPEECADPAILAGAMPIVLPSKAVMVRALLPPGTQLTTLRVHPIAPELQVYLKRYLPQKLGSLVGIASHWSEFQRFAQVMLVAAGLPADTLLVRDANESGWERGLEATVGVVVDSVTERELPAGVHPMRFTLLDADGMAQLRAMEAASVNGTGAAAGKA
jgi:DNA-binding transcriptional regulator YhcF (GntR family)